MCIIICVFDDLQYEILFYAYYLVTCPSSFSPNLNVVLTLRTVLSCTVFFVKKKLPQRCCHPTDHTDNMAVNNA